MSSKVWVLEVKPPKPGARWVPLAVDTSAKRLEGYPTSCCPEGSMFRMRRFRFGDDSP